MRSIIKTTNRRRSPRDPIHVPLSILCADPDGRETTMRAQLLDISAVGARLALRQPIHIHSTVSFYYHKLDIGGRGTVRYCRSTCKGYEVGVECTNGTGWSLDARAKADLLNLAAAVAPGGPVVSDVPASRHN